MGNNLEFFVKVLGLFLDVDYVIIASFIFMHEGLC